MVKYCEILAPAGKPDNLTAIMDAGADAIYVGLQGFSARPKEADFTVEELKWAIQTAHDRQVKLYIAVNGTIMEEKVQNLCEQLRELEQAYADAFITADFGLISLLCELQIKTSIHASTLLGVYNAETVRLLQTMGVTRIILSSDLYLHEMAEMIRICPDMEYEIVADGGVCFNSNRQCLLPHIGTMEDYQVFCQMEYDLYRDGEYLKKARRIGNCPAKIHRNMGMYLGAGICSFKIEGRTNPLWYILKRTAEMKKSKEFCMNHLEEIPGYMHYIYRNADWV